MTLPVLCYNGQFTSSAGIHAFWLLFVARLIKPLVHSHHNLLCRIKLFKAEQSSATKCLTPLKEILRLYPPAASGRYAPPKSGLNIQLPSGENLAVDGVVLYHCHSIIHSDNAVYGEDATEFVPERWLRGPEANTSLPSSAWRPFERGPRSCMGQDLVTIEVLAILACIVRRYDWEKVGLGATKRDNAGLFVEKAPGQFEVESTLYNVSITLPLNGLDSNMRQTMEITSKPVDGMKMRVKIIGQ